MRKETVMTEMVVERVQRYILDGGDEDLRRLLGISQLTGEMARSAFRRVGIDQGWTAIDCGCGPIGALAVIAEMVGPAGRVVGVDSSEPTIERARTVVRELELNNVELVAGDIHELDAAALGGPFDLAYTRLFLMHQVDPARTLRQIAGILRPGGFLVAQEALRSPAPRSHPDLDALGTYWDLLHQVMQRAGGVALNGVDDLERSARAAGLEVVDANGYFETVEPAFGFELHASTLAAARERTVRSGIASEQQIDDLGDALRAAKTARYEWVSTPFFRDLTLRKPAAA
jgi:ubiquinone/menaquinone biosynthesis C-methylase UbiE